jgi:hypothetical protein
MSITEKFQPLLGKSLQNTQSCSKNWLNNMDIELLLVDDILSIHKEAIEMFGGSSEY